VSVDLANMTRPATGFQLGDITPQFPMCGFSGQVVQILDHLGVRRHLQTFK
jgi:glutaredoxin-related protein